MIKASSVSRIDVRHVDPEFPAVPFNDSVGVVKGDNANLGAGRQAVRKPVSAWDVVDPDYVTDLVGFHAHHAHGSIILGR
jgi:hypothetical protein